MSGKKLELEIVALSHNVNQSHSYAVVLGEVNGIRRIPIVIGGFEAQAIAVALERMTPSRPLTHDLMKNLLNAFTIELDEILIYKLEEGIFFSKLICSNQDGRIEIDSRTSDALAMAVRFSAPIYTYEHIIESAGISMDEGAKMSIEEDDITDISTTKGNSLSAMTLEELEEKLNEVLDQEDYIMAASIRDEINKRKK